MAKYSYKGYDFEVSHDPSEEEFAQLAAHVDSLPPKELKQEPGFLDKLMDTGPVSEDGLGHIGSIPAVATDIAYGTAKAALSTGMGFGARAYGALTGQNDMPLNKLLESSSEMVEKHAPSVGSMTGLDTAAPYKAVMGALEPLATAPKKLGDIATEVTGSGDVGGSVEGYMNVLGIPGLHLAGKKVSEGMFALENKFSKAPNKAKVESAMDMSKAAQEVPKPVNEDIGAWEKKQFKLSNEQQFRENELLKKEEQGQLALPMDEQDGVYTAPQYSATKDFHPVIDENGMPIRAGKSIEVQAMQNLLQRNLWGDELAKEHPQEGPSLLDALNERVQEARDTREVPFQTENERHLKALENTLPASRELSQARTVANRGIYGEGSSSLVPEHLDTPFIRAAKKKASKAETQVETIRAKVEVGEAMPVLLKQAQVRAEKAKLLVTKAEKALADVQEKAAIGEASPIEVAQAKQAVEAETTPAPPAREVAVNFDKKAESEHINKTLGDIFPEISRDASTPEEVISLLKNSKDIAPERLIQKDAGILDVPNKALGRFANQFTKGMLFESFKHEGHDLLKFAHQVLSDGVDTYTMQNKRLIDQRVAPVLRALPEKELIEAAAVLVKASNEKVALTSEALQKSGFSKESIRAITTLQRVKAQDLASLNKTRAAVGKGPVDPSIGYMLGMASGNFRKMVAKKTIGADGKVSLENVAMIGSDSRWIMNNRIKEFTKNNPEYVVGEEMYNGVNYSKATQAKNLQEALLLLSDNSPNMGAYMEAMKAILENDTYHSLGGEKRSLGKKGIMGMEGHKDWRTDAQNARDFFHAQIRGTQVMSQLAGMSEAHTKLNAILSDPWVAENHPNAVAKVKDYMDRSMGKNTTDMGKAIDNAVGAFLYNFGVGPAPLKAVLHGTKVVLNNLFFLGNAGFYVGNMMQPAIIGPTIKSFMKSRGIDVNIDPLMIQDLTAKGLGGVAARYAPDSVRAILPKKVIEMTPFEKQAWEYGDKHGQSDAQLITHSPRIRKDMSMEGAAYWKESIIDDNVGKLTEGSTRAGVYITLAKILQKAGFEKDPQIFSMAADLTNLVMVDYRSHEGAKITEHMGMFGPLAKNLTSFPLHSNSLQSLLFREGMKESGSWKPFGMMLLSSFAVSGIMGMAMYQEANFATTHLSQLFGRKTTLDDIVLKIADRGNTLAKGTGYDQAGSVFATGAAAWAGLDLHNTLGMGSRIPGFTGGSGKAVDIGKDLLEVAGSNSNWNRQQLIKDATGKPGLIAMEHMGMLSHTLPNGKEISYNKKGESTIERNAQDKFWAKFGLQGTHEAAEKAKQYNKTMAETYYAKKQTAILDDVTKEIAFRHGKLSPEYIKEKQQEYLANDGDVNNFIKHLNSKEFNLNTTTEQEDVIRNSKGSVQGAKRLQRMFEK